MKKFYFVLIGLILFSSIFAQYVNMGTFPWNIMNGFPNVIVEFDDNAWFASERGDISKISMPRLIKKYGSNDVEYKTIPYGYCFSDASMYWGGKDGVPLIWYGDINVKIVTVKTAPTKEHPKGTIFKSDKNGIDTYCKVVSDTLKYEEDPQAIENFIKERGLTKYLIAKDYDMEYKIPYFKDGSAGLPECNNFIILKKLIPKQSKVIPPPPIPIKAAPLRPLTISPATTDTICSNYIEFDAWVNSSFTQLYRPKSDSIFSAGIISYNITRNYDEKKSFDLLGGARVKMSVGENWGCFGEISGGTKDRVGEASAMVGFTRYWDVPAGTLSLSADVNPQWWQFVYWDYTKFNIVSPTHYSIRAKEHKPWIEGVNLGAELKLSGEYSYVLARGSFDPKQWNNSAGLEAKTEGDFFGYFLGNYKYFSPNKFVDSDSLIFKPERNNYLIEVKAGKKVKETESGNISIFADGRLDHQEVQQPRVDGNPYQYKYVRTDIGIGIQIPVYTENAQVIFSYVDIKDADWKNYGWCIRIIWNIF